MHLYPEIYIPENLYLIGTVNMDETTFPFSKKVLDRANTIEFSYVDLVPDFEEVQDAEACEVTNDFLKSEYIVLKGCGCRRSEFCYQNLFSVAKY